MNKITLILIIFIIILLISLIIITQGFLNFKNVAQYNYLLYEQSQNRVKMLESELEKSQKNIIDNTSNSLD